MKTLVFYLLFLLWGASASAAETRTICTYDPGGKAGDYFRIMEGYAIEASKWDVELQLKAYTDEQTAAKDYEAGHCDGVLATGVRLQRFNRFPSTIEAMGALPTYGLLSQMVATLANYESAAQRLSLGENQTVGFISAGAVYLFVRDRSVDSVAELAGKRIATMDYDKAAPVMVDRVGGVMVPADLGSIGPKFNNGGVDACYMSAPGYRPFELWRGLEPNGGVIRLPLAQATLQLTVRTSQFPDGFGSLSRKYFSGKFAESVAISQRADADIPAKYWIDLPKSEIPAFEELFLSVRLQLRDQVGAYDGMMLTVMRKLRCAENGARAECAEQKE